MKIYIGSPFFTEEQLNTVKLIELALEESNIDYFSPRSEGILINMTPEEREKAFKDIYNSNIEHMNECNAMIANIDDRDLGTTFEIGWFSCSDFLKKDQDRPIFSYSNHDYQINVMLRQSVLVHNTKIENLITNIKQYQNGEQLTIFDELTNNVT